MAKQVPVEPNFRTLLKDLGLSESNILRRARLPEDLFSRTNHSISLKENVRLWNSFEEEAKDPLLPLRIGQSVPVNSMHPLIIAALCSEDLLQSCQRIGQFKRLVSPQSLDVALHASFIQVTFSWLGSGLQPPPFLGVAELVALVQLARIGTREHIRPLNVTTTKLPEKLEEYEQFFGGIVEKGASFSLCFSVEDATRPFLTANEFLWKSLEPTLNKQLSELTASASMAERVQSLLIEALPAGRASVDAVSKKLALSRRTLQRRLSSEGTSFQAVLNQTREKLAKHYLIQTSLTGSEISFLLGFDEPSSFSRAFVQWTGHSPEHFRQAI
ncbi:MAG: AraC family transcriptional regulator [Deltaproteobacteria bacterium]|nr:MAG: AraC family transcriptional regulator [Deltaproteobacteria bacterium]